MMMKKSIILMLSLVIVGSIIYFYFNSHRERDNLFLYIKNESFDTPEVDLQISINDSVLIDTIFIVSEIPTYYFRYHTKLSEGRYKITALSRIQNVTESQIFHLGDEKHIFIVYDYHKKSKETMDTEKRAYGKNYPVDSIITPKMINISSRDKIPLD